MDLRRLLRFGARRVVQAGDRQAGERRRSPRVAVFANCRVYDPVRLHTRPSCRLVNVNLHGLSLQSAFLTRVGDEFVLTFSLAGRTFTDCAARVVWSRLVGTDSVGGLALESPLVSRDIKKALLQQFQNARP